MENINDNYLINELKDGKNLDIVLLSHNAYWHELQKLDERFDNCRVTVFGSSTIYIKSTDIYGQIENSDLIIFYSRGFYDEYQIDELKDIAFRVSNDKNKRVSIGYSYFLPVEQRPYEGISRQIKIISFKNCEEFTEETYETPYFSPYNLTELTLATVDNYDIEKTKKLERKL